MSVGGATRGAIKPAPRLYRAGDSVAMVAATLPIAWAINFFLHDVSLWSMLRGGAPLAWQLAGGALAGAAVGALSMWVFSPRPGQPRWIADIRAQQLSFLDRVDLSGASPLVLALCAGVWEEILFRGALQPVIGNVAASLLFVLCHAGTAQFGRTNLSKAIYGAIVFAMSCALGLVAEQAGLAAAIAMHVLIDVVTLYGARRLKRQGA